MPSIVHDDDTTRELIEAEGVRYAFMEADITAPGIPQAVVATCVERLGSIDILINSAGIVPLAGCSSTTGRHGMPRSPSTSPPRSR